MTAADSTGPMPALDPSGLVRSGDVTGPMPQIAIEAKLADFTAWRRDADRKLSRLEGEVSELRSTLASLSHASVHIPGADRSRDQTAPILPEFKALAENPAVWSSVAAGMTRSSSSAASPSAATTAPVLPATSAFANAEAPSHGVASVIVAPDSAPLASPGAYPPGAHSSGASPPHVVSNASAARAPRVEFDLQMRPGEMIDIPNALDGGRRKRVVGWLFVAMVFAAMTALVISSLASQR